MRAGDVTITWTSDFEMNLISGRAVEHRDSWDLSKCSPQGMAFLNAARASYGAGKAAGQALKSFDSMDEEETGAPEGYMPDPTDPNKFFQQQEYEPKP